MYDDEHNTLRRATDRDAVGRVLQRARAAAAVAVVVATAATTNVSAAESPGAALRRYLDARWKGDVAAAEAVWDAGELRRSQALGTRYPGLEARFDDNLLWTAAARAGAGRPVVADSTVSTDAATFTVVTRAGAAADTLRWGVRHVNGEWRVGSAFEVVTRPWSVREGRFVRVRVARLRDFNADALTALDAGVERILQQLGAPEQTRLRLERLKVEYALCKDDAGVREICGSTPPGYRLAGERVVTRSNCDLGAIARLLVHVVAKELPQHAVPVLEHGTAAALGGFGTDTDVAMGQRSAALWTAGGSALEGVLDPARFTALPVATRVPLAAAWAGALLRGLGPERFLTLYEELSAASDPARAFDAAAVRQRLETATGRRGAALVEWGREHATRQPSPLNAGCGKAVPVETQNFKPVLRWRDAEERWALEAFPVGDEYVFVLQPYSGPVPAWAQRLADSLAVVRGGTVTPRPKATRPPGDPPQIVITLKRRMYSEPEAYESPLFRSQFRNRNYSGELFGMFIAPDAVRVWDYRRDVLVAGLAPDITPADAKTLYDQAPGRICFRLRRDVLGMSLEEFVAASVPYTGE